MWSVEARAREVDVAVEAASWAGLLEESVLALAHVVRSGDGERSPMRRMRKIALPAGDETAVWRAWWAGLLALLHDERVLPCSAGIRPDSTPAETHTVVRCVPIDARRGELVLPRSLAIEHTSARATPGGRAGVARLVLP